MKDRTSIRELRQHLKQHLDSGKTVAIGTPYQLRAFLVSVPEHNEWTHAEKTKAVTAAKKAFLAAVRAEID